MRILAIDHGSVRIGIAISDELKMLALPLEVIAAEPFAAFIGRLRQILKEKEVELVLVGMPRNMDGSYGPAALKVREFVAVLKECLTVPVQVVDERLTSVQAHRMLGDAGIKSRDRKSKVDRSAAAIMLQSHLDGLS